MPPIKDSDKEYEAGRELDALIAEKVMGWNRRGPGRHVSDYNNWWILPDGKSLNPLRFCPSTDISAAWEVVLSLRNRWGTFTLVAGLQWHCYDNEDGNYVERMGSADTAPLAICRAALKAVQG